MVADARCPTCGGVKRPNGTTKGEPWCSSAPPPPYPPQQDQPIRIGLAGSPWPICDVILAIGLIFIFLFHSKF